MTIDGDEAVLAARSTASRALQRRGLDGSQELRLIGAGCDSTSFACGSMVVSVRREGDVEHEADLLSVLGRSRLALITPAVRFVDGELGVIACSRLPGASLLGRAAPVGLGPVLGSFLGDLHCINPREVPHVPSEPFDAGAWTEDLTGPAPLVRRTLADVPTSAPSRPVLCHGDLGAEHIFAQGAEVVGVIDWADACVADPERDFARILRDFGPAVCRQAVRAYGAELDDRRVLFYARCAAIEDLAYGAADGREAYAEAAGRSVGWLFDLNE